MNVLVGDCETRNFGRTYAALELGKVDWAECVGLCNDRDQVHASAQAFHDLNVERLQGVTSRADEVQAGMNTEVDLLLALRLLLLEHVALVLVVEELDDGLP